MTEMLNQPARRNNPTIREVALFADVSIATVSNVLHGKDTLYTALTAERVRGAVRELGYRPNSVARSLVGQRTKTLGFVVEQPHGRLTRNSYMSQLLDGYLEFSVRVGYQIKIITLTNSSCEINRQQLDDGSVDGLALFAPPQDSPLLTWASSTRIPVVVAGSVPQPCALPQVDFDDEGAAYRVATWIIGQGHRSIGRITGLLSQWSARRRERGILRAFQEAGLDLSDTWRYEGDYSSCCGETGAISLLEANPDLTAIICGNDRAALGAITALQQRGISVPDTVSIVGFDDMDTAQWINPQLTTMRQPMSEMGMKAAEILIRHIETGIRDEAANLLSGELIIRQSVRNR